MIDAPLKLRIFDALPMTVWACDRTMCIRYWNDFANQVYGFTKKEAIGARFIDLFVDDLEREIAISETMEIINGAKKVRNFLANDHNKQGERRRIVTNGFRIYDPTVSDYLAVEIGLEIPNFENLIEQNQRLREITFKQRSDAIQEFHQGRLTLHRRLKELRSRMDDLFIEAIGDLDETALSSANVMEQIQQEDISSVLRAKFESDRNNFEVRYSCLNESIFKARTLDDLAPLETELVSMEQTSFISTGHEHP
jgi:PAS domain S-box-containing protein